MYNSGSVSLFITRIYVVWMSALVRADWHCVLEQDNLIACVSVGHDWVDGVDRRWCCGQNSSSSPLRLERWNNLQCFVMYWCDCKKYDLQNKHTNSHFFTHRYSIWSTEVGFLEFFGRIFYNALQKGLRMGAAQKQQIILCYLLSVSLFRFRCIYLKKQCILMIINM